MKRAKWLVPFLLGALVVALGETLLAHSILADWIAAPLLLADTKENAEAIVVLGAGEDEFCALNMPAMRRTLLGAELFRAGRAPIVVFTGGKPRGETASCPIARVMADLAIQLGVPREKILVEDRSRNTWENATYTSSLLRPRGIHRVLLVTDSVHMRRAQACFRTQGFETGRASVPSHQLHPNNLYLLQETVHEYLGYWYYRLTKRIHGGRS